MATRTIEEKYQMFLSAVKANTICKQQRQKFNTLRSTPIGRYIEPEMAKDSALELIDCFHRIHNFQNDSRKTALQCLMKGNNCEEQIGVYVRSKN